MLAARNVQPVPFASPPLRSDADALTMLREMVAALGERVELLETRERISRTGLYGTSSRLRPRS